MNPEALHMTIDRANGIPLYVQLSEQIRLIVRRGILEAGDAMPTVRALAVALRINANTVARVYRDLQREGLLELKQGIGTFVADTQSGRSLAEREFEEIAGRAADLIAASRRAGLAVNELTRLIETLWKEERHAQG